MVTGNVVELDAVSVEVVEDGQADLVTLPVIRLGPASTEIYSHVMFSCSIISPSSVRPIHIIESPPRWPRNTALKYNRFSINAFNTTSLLIPPLTFPPVQKNL